jgi:hypothetical protein
MFWLSALGYGSERNLVVFCIFPGLKFAIGKPIAASTAQFFHLDDQVCQSLDKTRSDVFERALGTERFAFFAKLLAQPDDQGMVFIKQRPILGQAADK